MALQLRNEGIVSSLVLLDGSHEALATFFGQKKQKLVGSVDDIAKYETAVICSFVSHLAMRLDISDGLVSVSK
jgi:hypothetical protein